MMYRLPSSFLFMTQFLSQEISQELDCKDNQNDNDGCQDSFIVIIAVKSIGDGYVTNPSSANCPRHVCFLNKGNQGYSRHTIQVWKTSSKPVLPMLKFFT